MAIVNISLVLTLMSCLSMTGQFMPELTRQFMQEQPWETQMTEIYVSMAIQFQLIFPDRGYTARRDVTEAELLAKDTETARGYLSSLQKEFDCSFVFSALVHVYLTNFDSAEPLESVSFTEEAAYIVHHELVQQNYEFLEAVWLLYFYSSQADQLLIESPSAESSVDYKPILLSSNAAIKTVLEELTKSYGCKVYSRRTGMELREVEYADNIKHAMAAQSTVFQLTMASNKSRFAVQRSVNRGVGYTSREQSGIALEQLRSSYLMRDTRVVEDLIQTFGVQVDSGPIVERLLELYGETYKVNVLLHRYVGSFATLQNRLFTAFKAIALRIVIVYLTDTKRYLAARSLPEQSVFLVRFYGDYRRKLADHLNEFAALVGRPDDRHLQKTVRMLLDTYRLRYFQSSSFDNHIDSVYDSLRDMTSDDRVFSAFARRLTADDSAVDAGEIAEKYNVVYPADFDPLRKIIAVLDVYNGQIREINQGVNFGMYNSIACLEESGHYRRLADLETFGGI